MQLNRIKPATQKLGLYRVARSAHRHTVNRQKVRAVKNEMALYREFVSPRSLCFDVGSNLVALEPQDECITRCRRDCARIQTSSLSVPQLVQKQAR